MSNRIRSMAALAAAVCLAGTVGLAQSAGEVVYKANCQSCHGSTGTPNPGIAKAMDVKAASEYKTSEKEQIDSVKNGKNKMKAFSSKLTDAQIKDAVDYFRTLQ